MLINLCVIFLILFLGFVFSNNKGHYIDDYNNRKSFIKIVCLILILQSGFRNLAVGADTYQYYLKFEDVKKISWDAIYTSFNQYFTSREGKDPGYLAFQKIIQVAIDDFRIYLILIAFIFFSALGNFILKNTSRLNDAILAFVIYSVMFYSFFSITGIRQTIATSAAIFSFELIKKRKFVKFLLLLLLASTIHKSVLIFLPFYFIAQIKKTMVFYGVIVLLFPVLMAFNAPLSAYFKSISGYEDYQMYEGAGTFTFTLMLMLIAIVALLKLRSVLNLNENVRPYYNAFALAIFFTPLTWVNPSAMRVVQYFSIFLLLLLPNLIYSFQAVSTKIRLFIMRMTIALLIVLMIKGNIKSEYKFFWQDMKLGKNYQ